MSGFGVCGLGFRVWDSAEYCLHADAGAQGYLDSCHCQLQLVYAKISLACMSVLVHYDDLILADTITVRAGAGFLVYVVLVGRPCYEQGQRTACKRQSGLLVRNSLITIMRKPYYSILYAHNIVTSIKFLNDNPVFNTLCP